MNSLLVAADERAAKVDALQVVFFGLQVGDLADVVAVKGTLVEFGLSKRKRSVLLTLSRTADFAKYLLGQTCGRRR